MQPKTLGAARLDARAHTRGPLWSATVVALATIGCTVPGPRASETATDAMRRHLMAGEPLNSSISYLAAGDPQGVRLILVHGTPGSATGWADFLLDPPAAMEVVALDRPGFGRSAPAAAVPGLDAQAAAVVALLPADGRRVVLLGHSLGGAIVARVAAQHPSRVAAVVMLAASLDPALETIHPMQRIGAWPPVRVLLPRAIRNSNAELMALRPELELVAAMLPQITAPVIIVHGTKDDLVPMANVRYMQARLTGARCVKTALLEGHNHFLPWNSADAVRAAIFQAREAAC
jgi:pimeloyl-ACP methyl ester carboxylesterase